MRKDKNKAIALRKLGLSYNQIATKLSIPKSTLSTWLINLPISTEAQKKINDRAHEKSVNALIKRNKQQTVIAKANANEIIAEAKLDFNNRKESDLFLTAISLYWAEGYKKGAEGSKYKAFDFTNSDPAMIRLMLKFILEACKVESSRIRIQVIAHHNIDIEKAISFWQKLSGLPRTQFQKSSLAPERSSKNPRKGNSLPNGTVHLRVSDVNFFHTIIGWIQGLKEYYGV